MDKKLVKVGEASKMLGVCIDTIRNWERRGLLLPIRRLKGGTRFYSVARIMQLIEEEHLIP
jgi:DNA-binding transcriptional MerR regulator